MNVKISLLLALGLVVQHSECFPQASGNIAYSQPYGKLRPEQNERDKRLLPQSETPPDTNTMFLDSSVLMNVLADECVAVFALSQEGDTPLDCSQKMNALLKQFIDALKPFGIGSNDRFVDFIAQAKIYSYRVQDNVAKEELAGFELKKNVSILRDTDAPSHAREGKAKTCSPEIRNPKAEIRRKSEILTWHSQNQRTGLW
ncbi:MAG: hypothetical protein ABSH34_29510 [Verrucomicrobiota bacterium]|jgi:hypothetical protein